MTDYLPHDGSRPSLALRTDGLQDLRVVDAGDVEMPPGDIERALGVLEAAVEKVARAGAIPVVLGGDHSIAFPDAKGVANVLGHGRVSMIHFDAHADTGDIEFGSLWGHGQPMRRLIESGALRGDRFLQVGLRGYWPGPETLDWMAAEKMRSYEMTEIVHRGLEECLTEAFTIATDECDGVFLSVDIDVCDPGHAPGTGTPEPGGLSARQLLDAVRRICLELPVVGIDVVEVSPPYDHADITAALANRVVLEALSAIARRRQDERDGTTWDPVAAAARPLDRRSHRRLDPAPHELVADEAGCLELLDEGGQGGHGAGVDGPRHAGRLPDLHEGRLEDPPARRGDVLLHRLAHAGSRVEALLLEDVRRLGGADDLRVLEGPGEEQVVGRPLPHAHPYAVAIDLVRRVQRRAGVDDVDALDQHVGGGEGHALLARRLVGEEAEVGAPVDDRGVGVAGSVHARELERYAEPAGDLACEGDRHPARVLRRALGEHGVAEVDHRAEHAGRGEVGGRGVSHGSSLVQPATWPDGRVVSPV